jgi:hypothetical protein
VNQSFKLRVRASGGKIGVLPQTGQRKRMARLK